MNTLKPRPPSIDAVLFDLDGTVVDTLPHILASFRHATADVLGESPSDDELMHFVGIPLAHQMRHFTDDENTVSPRTGRTTIARTMRWHVSTPTPSVRWRACTALRYRWGS